MSSIIFLLFLHYILTTKSSHTEQPTKKLTPEEQAKNKAIARYLDDLNR